MESELQRLYEIGRQLHPSIPLDPAVFAAYLTGLPQLIPEARAGECFLVCASLQGEAAAQRDLDRLYLAALASIIHPIALSPDQSEELRQRLRTLFFVESSGRRSKLEQFQGKGPLGAWVRVVATRQALNLRRASRPVPSAAVDEVAPAPASNPERRLLAQELASALQQAIRDVKPDLPARELNALRLHLAGVSLERIADLHSAHRATVARWIQRTREALVPLVREALLLRLAVSPSSLDSLLRALSGRLDLDLASALAET